MIKYIVSAIIIALTIPVVTAQNINETTKAEVIQIIEPITKDAPIVVEVATPPIVEVVEQPKPIIETPTVPALSDSEKAQILKAKYNDICTYWFKHSTIVQVHLNTFYWEHQQYFTYELFDTNMDKIKEHFKSINRQSKAPEILNLFKTLTL